MRCSLNPAATRLHKNLHRLKDFIVFHRYGRNTGAKIGTSSLNYSHFMPELKDLSSRKRLK